MYVYEYIILKHFLDKYFAPQKLNQNTKKHKNQKENTNWKFNVKKWRFFRWQYLKFNINN